MKKPSRNWKNIKCQKILECDSPCCAVTTKGNRIAVGLPKSIKMYDRNSTKPLHTIADSQLCGELSGVTFYDQENILVSDYSNNNIKMFTIQGRHVRTIDRGSTTFEPSQIAISPDGHIYVCDDANHCVCVFDVNGELLFTFGPGSHGSGDKGFNYPQDLCFANDGLLYITDVDNRSICVYNEHGQFIRKFTTTYQPACIDATDCGHLIVSSALFNNVMIYTTGGDLVHVFGECGRDSEQFHFPFGVSVDSDGFIYIADHFNSRIQVF